MIDRCGRIGMLMALCVFYPQYLFVLQLFVSLEVAGCFSNHYRYRPVCSLVLDSLFLEITMFISLSKGRSLLRVTFIKQLSYVGLMWLILRIGQEQLFSLICMIFKYFTIGVPWWHNQIVICKRRCTFTIPGWWGFSFRK